MIGSLTSIGTHYQQTIPPNNNVHSSTQPEKTNTVASQTPSTGVGLRQNLVDFINTASPEKAAERIASIKSGGVPLAPIINFRQIMDADNGDELIERLRHLSGRLRADTKDFHQQELDLISKGENAGKTSKEILTDVLDLYDSQSDFFQLSFGWNGTSLTDPSNYQKLLDFTPNYVDTYA